MESDFFAAREYLRRAHDALGGKDNTSLEMRSAISMLMDAATRAERTRLDAKIVAFPKKRHPDDGNTKRQR
jgi:hypothetical protein